MASRDTDRSRANAAPALDVRGRVANHHHVTTFDDDTQFVACTTLRDRRQLATCFVIGAVRADAKPPRIDSRGAQLRARTRLEIAGEQSEKNVGARVERIEQI